MAGNDFTAFARDLKAADRELVKHLRRRVKEAADPVAEEVRRAAGFSHRIPGAVKVTTRLGARSAGVSIEIDAKKAPEARPLNADVVRHPVFGNRNVWVEQRSTPYFDNATAGAAARLDAAMDAVVDDMARDAGFR